MDYQPSPYYEDKHSSGFAVASIVFGIIAILTFCCIYTALPCSALSIIFALLSRGGERTFSNNAKIGLILGIIGLSFCVLLYMSAILWILLTPGGYDAFLMEYENQMQQYQSMIPAS